MSSGTSSPPIQPSIFLETSDGVSHEVEWEITTLCPLFHRELLQNNRGIPETSSSVVLSSGVDRSSLERFLEYCRFHLVPGRSNEEHMRFDKHFDELGAETLSNLLLAATSLEMEPLACRVRLAMEQKVTLPERKGGKTSVAQSGSAQGGHRDDRSIDDLLSYIEGSEEDGKGTRKSKLKKTRWGKKKSKKKKQQTRDSTLAESPKNRTQNIHSTQGTLQPTDASSKSQEANVIGETDVGIDEELGYDSAELDDDDDDDGWHPEMIDVGTQTFP